MAVDTKDLGIGKLREDLVTIGGLSVTVGWQGPSGAAEHPQAPGHSTAQVAAWNEYGTETSPPRPMLRVAFERHVDELRATARRAISDLIDGRVDSPTEAAARLGAAGVAVVRRTIDDALAWAEPLSQRTIDRKGHNRPLVDSYAMRRAASWATRRGDAIVEQGGEE